MKTYIFYNNIRLYIYILIYFTQHGIKKIRNSLLGSRMEGGTRLLVLNGMNITWEMFIAAYKWDVDKNAVRLITLICTHIS